MAGIVFVFPGQGAQKAGMGREFAEALDGVREEYFERADAVLGFALSQLCFEGPQDELTRTENAQPALYLCSLVATEALRRAGIEPAAVAGHSLGEYSALAAAGCFSFEDGLRVVRRRGELMAEVGDRVAGGMVAALGLEADEVEAACQAVSNVGVAEVANYNSPEQTVISGELSALEKAGALLLERGASRVVPLQVAAPFHSSLMAPLVEEMRQVLADTPVSPPRIPVVANVTADYVREPDEIRDALVRQLVGSVRWTESIRRLGADGYDTFVEAGPGRILARLVGQILPEARTFPAETPRRIAQLQERL